MNSKTRVCILTSSHTAYDERFFHKQAKTLAGAGYDVSIIAPHHADEVTDGIRVKAVPREAKRLRRLLLNPLRVLKAGISEKAYIYHFHDPELIPAGLVLRLLGRKVVYDVHEYYKLKLLSNTRLPGWIRGMAARAFDMLETFSSMFFNGVIVVDRVTKGKFNGRAVQVSNYPPLTNTTAYARPKANGTFKCVYAGGLTKDRGLFKMIEVMEHADSRVRLVLAGRVSDDDLERAKRLKGYEKVEYLGWLPWKKVLELLPGCDLGLILLQPTPAYIYAGENTVKLFEYMMSGLPVLSPGFPNLKRIVEQEGCGLVVDPTDPAEIAGKITYFADNPEIARRMGKNGRKAVMERYNWETEAGKLLGLYSSILGDNMTHLTEKPARENISAGNELTLEPADLTDIDGLTELLHMKLPTTWIKKISDGELRMFLRYSIKSPYALILMARSGENSAAGYIFSTFDTKRFWRGFALKHPATMLAIMFHRFERIYEINKLRKTQMPGQKCDELKPAFSWSRSAPDKARIIGILVREEHRGKGIATKLYYSLFDELKDRGCSLVEEYMGPDYSDFVGKYQNCEWQVQEVKGDGFKIIKHL